MENKKEGEEKGKWEGKGGGAKKVRNAMTPSKFGSRQTPIAACCVKKSLRFSPKHSLKHSACQIAVTVSRYSDGGGHSPLAALSRQSRSSSPSPRTGRTLAEGWK